MSYDLVRLVLDRSGFRGKPLHLLTLVFIADQTMKATGEARATRRSLVVDTGMPESTLRGVLRDLMKAGEVIGIGVDAGGRGNRACDSDTRGRHAERRGGSPTASDSQPA